MTREYMTGFSWIAHLRRRTTSGKWLPEIDGLRFIAIVSVLLFHLHNQLTHHYNLTIPPSLTYVARIFGNGDRGVPLFFIISGFILARPFALHHLFGNASPSLGNYFLRRVTRLEPPYLLNLVVVASGIAIADHVGWRGHLAHLAASASYLHYAVFREPSTINPAAWSLEIEVQFYILAPLLSMFFVIKKVSLRRALLIAAMIGTYIAQTAAGLSRWTLAGQMQYFLAGLLFADLFLTEIRSWKHDWRWDIVSIAGWPALFLLGDQFKGLWLPFLALLLYIAAMRGVLVYAVLRNSWIAVTGGMCYTIYLWHASVMTLVGRLLGGFPIFVPSNYLLLFVIQGIIKLAVVTVVCVPLFLLVERPCMDPNWPQKLANFFRYRSAKTPTQHEVAGNS